MMERLQDIINDLKKRDIVHVRAYFITEALKGYGHSPLLGGQESANYLHKMGLDDETIIRMKKKYLTNPHDMRESLEQSIFESIK